MIDKIVSLYRKAVMGLIGGLSGASAAVADEACFYDVGFMQTQIGRIQKEMKRIEADVRSGMEAGDNSDYGKKHRAELMKQRERLLFRMIFLASNSFKNLGDCVKMAEGHTFAFMECVEALMEYQSGNRDRAFQILEAYYGEHKSVEEHFLVNKVFGMLLADKGRFGKAIPFLTYALQFMPDDTDCLAELKRCYEETGERGKADTVSDVLSVLA
ncbi:MAG: hypothetical protein K6E91_06220 [Butyrivibrio sp.]|nr:hypothetical protein [Butyrivibrio sp.]